MWRPHRRKSDTRTMRQLRIKVKSSRRTQSITQGTTNLSQARCCNTRTRELSLCTQVQSYLSLVTTLEATKTAGVRRVRSQFGKIGKNRSQNWNRRNRANTYKNQVARFKINRTFKFHKTEIKKNRRKRIIRNILTELAEIKNIHHVRIKTKLMNI